jgi:hypothetical protein
MGTAQAKGTKSNCIICLEKHLKGIYCSQSEEHFICDDCFLRYVESVLNDAGKLIDRGCRIHCPEPTCNSPPFTTTELRKIVSSEIVDKYLDSLITLVCLLDSTEKGTEFDENDLDAATKVMIDAMSIACPSCHIALDPNPDGCCAIRCGSCSKYLCLLCLKIEPNSPNCHSHVRACPQNPSKNVFAPSQVRNAAHKRLQILSIQQKLRAKYGPKWRSLPSCKTILNRCRPVLAASGITSADLLATDESYAQATQSHPSPPLQAQAQAQAQPPQIIEPNLLYGFLIGLFVMHLLSSVGSYFSSAPQSCPTIEEVLDDSFELASSGDPDSLLTPTPSSSFSLWKFFVYIFEGCCYALAINFFTRQALVNDVPLLALLIVFLWYPIWILISSVLSLLFLVSYYLIFVALYYIVFSVAVLMTVLMVTQGFKERNLGICIVFWVIFSLFYGIKACIG